MAGFDYANLRDNTAEPLLARFGKQATLTKPGTPTGDEWNPTPGTPTEYTVIVMETQFSRAAIWAISTRAGTQIEQGDRLYLMSTSAGVEPAREDTLAVDGDVFQIINVDPLKPGPVTLLSRVHVRK
jgi:hypothetical protein